MVFGLPTDSLSTRTRAQHLSDHEALHLMFNAAVHVPAPTGVAATDTANIQAALDAVSDYGCILLQPGTYLVNGFTLAGNGINIVGAGMQNTILRCNSGDLFSAPATLSLWRFADFQARADDGHIFNGAFAMCMFERLDLINFNPDYCIVYHDSIAGVTGFIENSFVDCRATISLSHNVPAFYLRSTSAININRWVGGRYTYSGNYVFWLEGGAGGVAGIIDNNRFENVNFEITNGGNIFLKSCLATVIVGCGTYDLTAPASRSLIYLDKSIHNTKCQYTTIMNTMRWGGSLADDVHDIEVDQATNTVLINNGSTASNYSTRIGAAGVSALLAINEKSLGAGIVTASPNGTLYRWLVDDDGVLSTVVV